MPMTTTHLARLAACDPLIMTVPVSYLPSRFLAQAQRRFHLYWPLWLRLCNHFHRQIIAAKLPLINVNVNATPCLRPVSANALVSRERLDSLDIIAEVHLGAERSERFAATSIWLRPQLPRNTQVLSSLAISANVAIYRVALTTLRCRFATVGAPCSSCAAATCRHDPYRCETDGDASTEQAVREILRGAHRDLPQCVDITRSTGILLN